MLWHHTCVLLEEARTERRPLFGDLRRRVLAAHPHTRQARTPIEEAVVRLYQDGYMTLIRADIAFVLSLLIAAHSRRWRCVAWRTAPA